MARKKTRHKQRGSTIGRWWRRYEYKHTTLAMTLIVGFVLALDTALIQGLLDTIHTAGLLGVFLTGIMFVSFLTAGPATLILINIAPDYNPILLATVAATGSLIGDWIILRFVEDKVGYELQPLAKKYGIMPIIKQMRTKRFRPFAIVTALVFIASPLPDEAGLGLLGMTKTPVRKLMPVLLILNAAGIYLLVIAARALVKF